MTLPHVHWHRPVGETKVHVYYECRCGSRRSGVRTASRVVTGLDVGWLAGEERPPR